MNYFCGYCALLLLAMPLAAVANARSISVGFNATTTNSPTNVSGTFPILYDQTATCTTVGIDSQQFEESMSQYDSTAADDFVVPLDTTWSISYISVGGQYFAASGPAPALNVTFYLNDHGVPGIPVEGCSYSELTSFSDSNGAFGINLPSPCNLRADLNNNTVFWVSVQARMDYAAGGKWGWNGSSPVNADAAAWQNPGGGFTPSCPTWTAVATCVPGAGPDLCFAVAGGQMANLGDDGLFRDGFDKYSLMQSFDAVTAPALPSGWTSTAASGNPWTTVNDNSYGAPNSAFADDPPSVSDKVLLSPTFIESGDGAFEFQQSVDLEWTFDGAVLELSINGSAFQDILDAGGSFDAGGYNASISAGFGNPIAGRAAWSGSSGGYQYVRGKLPAGATGQTVKLRWRVASDNSDNASGYWLDSIKVD